MSISPKSTVVAEQKPRGLQLRHVRLTKAQHAAHEGGKCWGIKGQDDRIVWAQMLILEVNDDAGALLALAIMANKGVDAEAFFASFDEDFWTWGSAEADPVASTSWRISGWQDPEASNPGMSVQKPLEPGLTAQIAWDRVVDAAKGGLIRRAPRPQ